MVKDLESLVKGLGFNRFYIHGEDRGAEYGWVYAQKHIKESYVLEESGHHLANEQPEKLAEIIIRLLQFT